jgi:hypothetical protein
LLINNYFFLGCPERAVMMLNLTIPVKWGKVAVRPCEGLNWGIEGEKGKPNGKSRS